MRRVGGVGGVA
ncbi:hypothetical protein E2C01_070491 [Portunus trituberculatus]|uniref:Uncharacterized protein n=1 Tax=Portunus trituberculatus TaxID=210409 RepID=A0A5B7I3M5_PORTR|nr:hypothetical protein [Portunus trituberculatus]